MTKLPELGSCALPSECILIPLLYSVKSQDLLGFPWGSAGKESTCNVGDLDLILGWEDSLEKGKATHFSILAWRIPWTEEPGGPQLQRVTDDWVTKFFGDEIASANLFSMESAPAVGSGYLIGIIWARWREIALFFFFLMWTNFKVFIEFVTLLILLLLCFGFLIARHVGS